MSETIRTMRLFIVKDLIKIIQAPKKFGVFSDVHGNFAPLQELLASRPDIDRWFCLGDITDGENRFKGNYTTVAWWQDKWDTIPSLVGNHDAFVHNSDFEPRGIPGYPQLPIGFRFDFPDGKQIFAYHSYPDSVTDFVEPTLPERIFVDRFPSDEEVSAVLVGHNHKQFLLRYPYLDTVLVSVGSVCFGRKYVVVEDGVVTLHTF